MSEQTIYVVVNTYDLETSTPVQIYDNRKAAEQHATHLNQDFEYDKDVFKVREWGVLSEFNPQTGAVMPTDKPTVDDLLAFAVLVALIATLLFL